MKRKAILVAAAAIFVVLILQVPKLFSTDKQPTSYQFEKVKKASIEKTVTATGTIEPILQVEVGTQVSGVISKIFVDYNSHVKRGQLLAEIDRTVLESELISRRADLRSNKAEYDYQKKNFDRVAGLYRKNLISQKEYETAEYECSKAKAAYDKSRSDMLKAKTNLSYASICSPIDGVVLSRAVDEGQTVAASFNTPTLFTIANDLEKMRVIANVDEADIGEVKAGQRVTFTVDAFPDDVFNGEVTQVRLESTTVSNVVTYKVVVNAPNPELKLKPGLTANITIITSEKNNILVVPSKAFRFNPNEGAPGKTNPAADVKNIWVKTAKGISPQKVKVGITDGVSTEIVSGLREGDAVAVSVLSGNEKSVTGGEQKESSPFMPKRPGQK
ncbi:efflux RND transporter periplasmic adaptor subunit [uncultured Acetobacteroides sp.]|uniref:efflux RND transporter periplasmic adaptor subunit n=1 Tax=uncultured Acetobacteroides sp. TaxID=1760811 RepID=UPI0029F4CDF5|nr:efflux RND transporter periplasmic adaptor subunit [uncultured Acetobacteroides sp.]